MCEEYENNSGDISVRVDGLSKSYESSNGVVQAIEDISFSIGSGEIVGILGPNGAGKTTLIKSMLGLVIPDEGDVYINGVNVYESPKEAYAMVDAMYEGARNNFWRLTVQENLTYFSSIGGKTPDVVDDKQQKLLNRFDLADRADDPVRDLSRGMKQKVSLATVLAGDVSVIFLDEPTLGLDIESSLTLRRELIRLVEDKDLTVIVSSHDMDVIEDICGRVIILNEGEVASDMRVSELLESSAKRGYQITMKNLNEDAETKLRERFSVRDFGRFNDRVHLEVAADHEEFYEMAALLDSHNIAIERIETIEPDLSETFLEIVGGTA